jgi:uncharacterized membrane protein
MTGTAMPAPPTGAASGRLEYLDWLRGLAVVVMIEAHTLDAWTALADRTSWAFGWSMVLAGMAAPLFLFMAGISVSLAAAARARRVGHTAAARSVMRRGWQVLGLAFLFRIYTWLLSPGASIRGWLKVDILNVMGPSIVLAAAIWQLGRTTKARVLWLSAATVTLAMLTPIVRNSPWLDVLPDPLETYFRPGKGLSTFAFFPWTAFVTAGAALGALIHGAGREGALRLAGGAAAAGVALWAAGYGLSFLPSIYPAGQSSFWTTSPAFLCLRVGVLTAAVAAAWAWTRRPWPRVSWSPLEVLGASSLFVYWIHIEMVYGLLATPLRKALPFPWAVLAYALFTAFMLWLTLVKLKLVASWEARRSRSACGPAA